MQTLIICDIDNVLFDTIEKIVSVLNTRYGTKLKKSDITEYSIVNILKKKYRHKGKSTVADEKLKLNDINNSIFKSAGLYRNLKPLPLLFHMGEIVNNNDGDCSIYFLTNRFKNIRVRHITEEALLDWNIKFPCVLFGNDGHTKKEPINEIIDTWDVMQNKYDGKQVVIIDDHPKIIKEALTAVAPTGIKKIIFAPKTPWNAELNKIKDRNLFYIKNDLIGPALKKLLNM